MNMLRGICLAATLVTLPVFAALEKGSKAPDFDVEASLAGEPFHFSLAEALESGPVVLYFYPAAFTPGCTIEAHKFAEATEAFAEYGATVIGVSSDDLEKLHKFSVSECRNKFAVAADPEQRVIKAYDAVLDRMPQYADRISYVISPEGEIIHTHVAMEPNGHITESLAAVKSWADKQNTQ